MSELKFNTHGGRRGHLLRRVIHCLMFVVPLVYFFWGSMISGWVNLTREEFVWVVVVLVVVLECIRLVSGWVIFGQRSHERRQISSFAWGVVAMGLVLLYAPGFGYYLPIIWVCSWVDPLVGEMRAHKCPNVWVWLVGIVLALLIWAVAVCWLGVPWYWGVICALLAVVVEPINWRYIDDNALMQLVPLFVVLLFSS